MSRHQRMPFLICYDISDPARLQKVHRLIEKHGIPIQYSVFFGRFNQHEVNTLLSNLEGLIKASEDDIRIYPLNKIPRLVTRGQYTLPPDLAGEGGALIL